MSRLAIVAAVILVAALQLGTLLFGDTTFAYRHDWNIPFFHNALVSMWHETDGLTAWNREQLGSPPFYPTLAPYLGSISALATVGLSTAAIERILLLCTFVVSGLGMYWLLGDFELRRAARCLGAFFFMATPYLFNQVCTGVLADTLAYAAMPVVAAAFLHAARCKDSGRALLLFATAGCAWAIASFHPVYFVLDGLVVVALAVGTKAYRGFAIACFAALLSDAYFILPLFSTAAAMGRDLLVLAPKRVVFDLSPPLSDVLRLTGFNGFFAERSVGTHHASIPWTIGGYAVCILSFGGLLLRGTRLTRTLAVALVIAMLLATGTTIFGEAYYWIVSHLPGGAAFRESYRFTAPAALFQSIGLAVSVAVAQQWLTRSLARGYTLAAFAVAALASLPFWLGGLAQEFPQTRVPSVAAANYDRLQREPHESRMLYLPLLLPISAGDSDFVGVDPMISWPPRPSFGNYLLFPIARAFASALYNGNEDNLSTLSRWLNLEYVDRRYWLKGRFAQYSGAHAIPGGFTDDVAVRSLVGIGARPSGGTQLDRVWSLPFEDQNRVRPLSRLVLTTGSLANAAVLGAGDNAVAFFDQLPDAYRFADDIGKIANPQLTVLNGNYVDVIEALVPPKYHVQPGSFSPEIDANAGWASMSGSWSSWWWYRDRYAQSLQDLALSGPQSHKELVVTFDRMPLGPARLLVRAFSGPMNGRLLVRAQSRSIPVVTKSGVESRDAQWYDLGSIEVATPSVRVTVSNVSGENAVADVVVVPFDEYGGAEKKAAQLFYSARLTSVLTYPGAQIPVTILHAGEYTVSARLPQPASRDVSEGFFLNNVSTPVMVRRGSDRGERSLRLRPGTYTAIYVPDEPGVTMSVGPSLAAHAASGTTAVRKISDYDYEADVTAPGVVELATNFAPGWKISAPDAIHLRINGYANGWIVPRAQHVRIWYAPYSIAIAGRILSLTVIALVILGLCVSRLRRPKEPSES